MGNPNDWLNQARNVGVLRLPDAPLGGPPPPPPAEPLEAIGELRRRSRQEELEEEELEELRSERDLKRLEREARLARLKQQIENAGSGQSDTATARLMETVLQEINADRAAMRDEIRELRTQLVSRAQTGDADRLRQLEDRLRELATASASPANARGGLSTLIEEARALNQVREELERALPRPQVSEAVSRNEALERHRIDSEMRLRGTELDLKVEELRASREAAAREADYKMQRTDRLGEMLQGAATQFLPALAANRAAGALAGTGSAAATTPPAAPAPAAQEPWTCPYPQCGQTNFAPTGSSSATCSRCKQLVLLRPANAPPPDTPAAPVSPPAASAAPVSPAAPAAGFSEV